MLKNENECVRVARTEVCSYFINRNTHKSMWKYNIYSGEEMKLQHGAATLVLGVQYGDEGKGKLVDVLAEQADLVCRVQGGNNAGHTIWVNGEKIVTQLLPSGILRDNCEIGIGAGVVVDPFVLRDELKKVKSQGYDITPERLHVDYRASVILPYHKNLDLKRELERSKSTSKIGTTGRGIGPTYASRAYREGPRIAEISSPENFQAWLNAHPHLKEGLEDKVLDEFLETAEALRPYMKDLAMIANNRLAQGARVLLEGAQGAMLDVSFGTYPYVTSSNLVAGSCAGGLGIPPWKITNILGVIKAYSTRVGNGPYPAELFGDFADELRKRGNEFGTNTGRPRSVGWLDLVALRYLSRINGLTGLAIMKADVLAGIEHIGIITAYRDKRTQKEMIGYPMTQSAWENVEPVVEYVEGWESVAQGPQLNKQYQNFIKKIEKFIDVPSIYISTGAERSEGLWV
ncbi:adenylosuccinate synthase [Fluviispira multicolorata]|uniref:Adenylosuccinate synthetase n=2 Tax=Fluviispira multicolorata TaxID=2654512 RepID=A0A833JEF5_9BACT|nr:adenylosuccinate synthase [Fluviispira multicolorata]